MGHKYDFGGYATRNDLRCSDGRTIRKNAFAHQNGQKVPLVYMHNHDDPEAVIGHGILENREDGVWIWGSFNDTPKGKTARDIVAHDDVVGLSIWANQLQQSGGDVLHGDIKEVSLVLAGANPGAYIESLYFAHSDTPIEDEAIISYVSEEGISHADKEDEEIDETGGGAPAKEEKPVAEEKKERTVQDVIDTMNDEQKTVLYGLLEEALGSKKDESDDDNEEEKVVKHNVFDSTDANNTKVLSHSDMQSILADGKRMGSLKEAVEAALDGGVLVHADGDPGYGIGEKTIDGITYKIDDLFPDARNMTTIPDFIKRPDDWVSDVMGAVHHTPFSRIKSMHADITADDARAKGYLKGNLKKEEVFTLLKRTTTPTTVYKKQKMDRDDIVDITDFDVVAWIKGEMRGMLNEEIARAILVSDGRSSASDEKISELCIRPIWTDADLYTIKATFEDGDNNAKTFIRTAIKSRKDYRGSGNPVLYTTEDWLTDMLLIEDLNGRVIYDTEEKLRNALRVRKIVTVPVMEGLYRTVNSVRHDLCGIIVNLADYNVGADKGGAVNMFDDFDIDYNQQKYLIETRCSGALTKPYSAIVIEKVPASNEGE